MSHEERLKATDVVGVLDWDEKVVPVAVGYRYMEDWVGVQGEDVGDGNGDVEREMGGGLYSLSPLPHPRGLRMGLGLSLI